MNTETATRAAPCMRTMSVKILAKCWQNGYKESYRAIYNIMLKHVVVESDLLNEFARSSAKKEVADAVETLIERKTEDIFIPLLHLRAQKEILKLSENRVTLGDNAHSGYLAELISAWEHIGDLTERVLQE